MNNCKTNGCATKHNEGITCTVKNCAYHGGDCYCDAKEISVGPAHANTSADTVCATFKPRA